MHNRHLRKIMSSPNLAETKQPAHFDLGLVKNILDNHTNDHQNEE